LIKMTQNPCPDSKDWDIGKVLLNEYVIQDILGTGDMGKVYLVALYRFPGHSLALKTFLNSTISDRAQKRMFMNELQTWIDLTEHPHITAFRFFRTIEDRLAIFSEYVSGGSLDRWIKEKKLVTLKKYWILARE